MVFVPLGLQQSARCQFAAGGAVPFMEQGMCGHCNSTRVREAWRHQNQEERIRIIAGASREIFTSICPFPSL